MFFFIGKPEIRSRTPSSSSISLQSQQLLLLLLTTSLIGKNVDGQTQVQTPFIVQCYKELIANDLDDNSQLDSNEYLQFTKEYANRPDCQTNFEYNDNGIELSPGSLPLGIQVVFNQLSCECLLKPGADKNCCILFNANIPIDGARSFLLQQQQQQQQQNGVDPSGTIIQEPLIQEEQIFLRQVCLRTTQAIQGMCGPDPNTPRPDGINPLPGPVDPPDDEETWLDKFDIFTRNGLIGFAIGAFLLLCPLLLACCMCCRRLLAPPPKYVKHSASDDKTKERNNRDIGNDGNNQETPASDGENKNKDIEVGDSVAAGADDPKDYRGPVDVDDLSSTKSAGELLDVEASTDAGGDETQVVSAVQPSSQPIESDQADQPPPPIVGRRSHIATDDGDAPPPMASKAKPQPPPGNDSEAELMALVTEVEQQQEDDNKDSKEGVEVSDDGDEQYMVDTGESSEDQAQSITPKATNKASGDEEEEKREIFDPQGEEEVETIQLKDVVAAAAERDFGGVGGGYASTDDEIATIDTDELIAMDETDDDEPSGLIGQDEEDETDEDNFQYEPIGSEGTRRHLQEISYNLEDAASSATTGEGSAASDLVLSWIVNSTLNALDKDDELKLSRGASR